MPLSVWFTRRVDPVIAANFGPDLEIQLILALVGKISRTHWDTSNSIRKLLSKKDRPISSS